MYTPSKLTAIIGQYRQILIKDGFCTEKELIEMLEVDADFEGVEPTKIKEIVSKILNTATVESCGKRDINEINVERMELYLKGLVDYEIADIQGVTASTVAIWRKKRVLKTNFIRSITQEEENQRMELYNKGLSDRQLSKEIGRSYQLVYEWRKKKGLPKNKKEKKINGKD